MAERRLRLDSARRISLETTLADFLIVVAELPTHTWLLPFYAYPANCLVLYLLSSMVFTATVCQVSGSELSVGTEVVVVVQTPIGHENYDFAIY